MSKEALKMALEFVNDIRCGKYKGDAEEISTAIKQALEQPVQEPVVMRMPKVGDRVVCIEDESLGTVVYLTAGGSPEIKFDDGSHGTYMLREFAELFGYTTPTAQPAPVQDQKSCKLCTHEQRHYMEMTGPCRACRFYSNFASATLPAQEIVCSTGLCHYKPAAQRQWVDLTNEQRSAIIRHHSFADDIIRVTAAKLKELNT
jgi:hypothetical protein